MFARDRPASRSGSASGCRPAPTGRWPGRLLVVAVVLLVVLDVLALLAQVGVLGRPDVRPDPRRRPAGSTSARCRCSRPSWPSSRWRCGAPTCWSARAQQPARWRDCRRPAVPGRRAAVRAGRLQRPRHHALPGDPVRRPAVGGRRAAAGLRRLLGDRRWPASSPLIVAAAAAGYRLARLDRASLNPELRPSTSDRATRRWRAATRSPTAAGSASAWARASSSGAGCPTAHNDFIFAVIAEELGVVGCFVVLALFARARLHRAADRPPGRRPVPPDRRRRRHHLAGRPGHRSTSVA